MHEYLLTPGPVEMPREVYMATQKQIIGHRTKEFSDLFIEIEKKLSFLLKVDTPSVILPSSGTGALECLAVNFLCKGDKFISASCGVFGDRFRTIAEKTGATGIYLDFQPGEEISPNAVAMAVSNNPDVKCLLLTHNETSTGVVNPIKEIIRAIPEDKRPIILVDCVSSVGAMEMYPALWGIDAIATASQKGLLSPPGLGIVWLSEKAWKYVENNTCDSYYFDLKLQKKYLKKNNFANPYTPPVTLYYALNAALDVILKDGIDEWFKAHKLYATALAEGIKALGLELLVKKAEFRSPGVTAIKSSNYDTEAIRATLNTMGIVTAGGQADMKGKLIRIAHYDDKRFPELSIVLSCIFASLPNKKDITTNFMAEPLKILTSEE